MVDLDMVHDDDPDYGDGIIEREASGIERELSSGNILELVKGELLKDVSLEPVVLIVESRPSMTVTFDPNVTAADVQRWRRQCVNKTPEKFDALKFSCLVIVHTAVIITMNGSEVHTDDGEALNFRNPELLSMLSAAGSVDAVRKFYGVDGYVFHVADKVLTTAGFDNEGRELEADPTL